MGQAEATALLVSFDDYLACPGYPQDESREEDLKEGTQRFEEAAGHLGLLSLESLHACCCDFKAGSVVGSQQASHCGPDDVQSLRRVVLGIARHQLPFQFVTAPQPAHTWGGNCSVLSMTLTQRDCLRLLAASGSKSTIRRGVVQLPSLLRATVAIASNLKTILFRLRKGLSKTMLPCSCFPQVTPAAARISDNYQYLQYAPAVYTTNRVCKDQETSHCSAHR